MTHLYCYTSRYIINFCIKIGNPGCWGLYNRSEQSLKERVHIYTTQIEKCIPLLCTGWINGFVAILRPLDIIHKISYKISSFYEGKQASFVRYGSI